MKKLLLFVALCSVAALTISASSCKKKEHPTKVVKAKADAHETKAYKTLRGEK